MRERRICIDPETRDYILNLLNDAIAAAHSFECVANDRTKDIRLRMDASMMYSNYSGQVTAYQKIVECLGMREDH